MAGLFCFLNGWRVSVGGLSAIAPVHQSFDLHVLVSPHNLQEEAPGTGACIAAAR
jgi:hypothetical protein